MEFIRTFDSPYYIRFIQCDLFYSIHSWWNWLEWWWSPFHLFIDIHYSIRWWYDNRFNPDDSIHLLLFPFGVKICPILFPFILFEICVKLLACLNTAVRNSLWGGELVLCPYLKEIICPREGLILVVNILLKYSDYWYSVPWRILTLQYWGEIQLLIFEEIPMAEGVFIIHSIVYYSVMKSILIQPEARAIQ